LTTESRIVAIFLEGSDGVVFHEGAWEQFNGAKPMCPGNRLALGHAGVGQPPAKPACFGL